MIFHLFNSAMQLWKLQFEGLRENVSTDLRSFFVPKLFPVQASVKHSYFFTRTFCQVEVFFTTFAIFDHYPFIKAGVLRS